MARAYRGWLWLPALAVAVALAGWTTRHTVDRTRDLELEELPVLTGGKPISAGLSPRPLRVLGLQRQSHLQSAFPGGKPDFADPGTRFVLVWAECRCAGAEDWTDPVVGLADRRGRRWGDNLTMSAGGRPEAGTAVDSYEVAEAPADAAGWVRYVKVFAVPEDARDLDVLVNRAAPRGSFSEVRWRVPELTRPPSGP